MVTTIVAFIVDFLIGDPQTKWHPVALIGSWITLMENLFYSEKSSKWEHYILGSITVIVTLLLCYNLTLMLVIALDFLPYPQLSHVIQGVILSFMICPHSLAKAAREVYRYLRYHRLNLARQKVGLIVGRDTENLDAAEVTRATVETVAENTIDGIVSPLFFFAIGGLPLAVVYRAANTLDSMIGYKNDKYIYFGRVAARLDDVLNFIPARISGLLFVLVAKLCHEDYKNAWKMLRRDAKKHPSPNGGCAEATVAGALGIRLGGYNSYFGQESFRAYMGEPLHELEPQHIRRTIRLMYGVSLLAGVLTILCRIGLNGLWN